MKSVVKRSKIIHNKVICQLLKWFWTYHFFLNAIDWHFVQLWLWPGDRLGKAEQEGRKEGNKKGNKKNKKDKKNKHKRKKNIIIPNKFGVQIKSYGKIQLYNLKNDPEERQDLSDLKPDLLEKIKAQVFEHFYELYPRDFPEESTAGDPKNWGGYFGPGWCDTFNIVDDPAKLSTNR